MLCLTLAPPRRAAAQYLIRCGGGGDGFDLASPEERPIHEDRDGVECDRADEGWGESVLDLEPAADGGAESPAEVPCHAGEAGNRGAPGRLDVFHHKGLVDRAAHVH